MSGFTTVFGFEGLFVGLFVGGLFVGPIVGPQVCSVGELVGMVGFGVGL